MSSTGRKSGHAVVVGGSVAGLVAARALAEQFAEVTVLERDDLSDGSEARKGVPQARHAHGILAGGRQGLERMFPGFGDRLVARGALDGDILGDSRWFGHGVELARAPTSLRGLLASRPLLEDEVRRSVTALPNVTLRNGLAVEGLIADEARSRIIGVRLLKSRAAGVPEMLAADLVVDASGRGSRSSAWLESLGFAGPEEETIDVGIAYTTRMFERRGRGAPKDPIALIVGASPPSWRFGVALAVEGDHWIVTLGGYFGDGAPAEQAGFLDFARTLQAPVIADLLAVSKPMSEFANYRFAGSQRRRYERLSTFPEGYLVFGDALCSFNPVYGQGMTSAVLQAEALAKCLGEGQEQLAARFFVAASKVIDTPWQIAAGADLAHPSLVNQAGLIQRLMNRYVVRLYRSAADDPVLASEFLTVANLLAEPSRFFAPSIILRVISAALRSRPAVRAPEPAAAFARGKDGGLAWCAKRHRTTARLDV
jgi:2-polyprenyl-6-methoxyphenol hydroxylase-like FAD-dependent oxidoreductase